MLGRSRVGNRRPAESPGPKRCFRRPSIEGEVKNKTSPCGCQVAFFLASGVSVAPALRADRAPLRTSAVRLRTAARFLASVRSRMYSLLFSVLDELEADLFSHQGGEPSFYQGLFGPSLRSVLRGGIAYAWGLHLAAGGPSGQWMLTLEPSSSWFLR